MTWTNDYVVLVGAGPGDSPRWLGTGFVVSHDRVVTARHVVSDSAGAPRPALRVRREGGPWSAEGAVTARWLSPDPLDVAVLEVAHGGEAPSHPLAVFSEEATQPAEGWYAQGYPKVCEQAPSDRQESVSGTTQICTPPTTALELDVIVGPDVWNGLSGGAVVVRQRVRGVVRGVSTGWSNKRITATAAHAFLGSEEFLKALGLDHAARARLEDLTRVEAEAQRILGAHAMLADRLARRVGVDASDLAATIVRRRTAARLVDDLQAVHDEFWRSPVRAAEASATLQLLCCVIPYVTDWRALQTRYFTATGARRPSIELPYRTETIAEIVLAGLHGRRCVFVDRRDEFPCGVAMVQLPASNRVPIMDCDGEGLRKAVVEQLARQLGVGASALNLTEKIKAVNARLRRFAGREGELQYYFVFVDPSAPGGQASQMWSLVTSRLGGDDGLPELTLVRMSSELTDAEADIADGVQLMVQRSQPPRPKGDS